MKASRIIWGLLIVAAAVLLILQGVGVLGDFTSMVGELSVWRIVLAVFLLAIIIERMVKLHFDQIFVPLGFIFMLFEKNIAFLCGVDENIINNWIIFGCSLLLSIGVRFLIPRRRKKIKISKKIKAGHVHVDINSDDRDGPIEVEVEEPEVEEPELDVDDDEDEDDEDDDDDDDDEKGDFGTANSRYFDGATFKRGYVKTRMGASEVSFENADKYTGGGVLNVDCRMGAIEVRVPKSWSVAVDIDNTLGAVDISHKNSNPDAPVLTITGKCNLGAIEIQ